MVHHCQFDQGSFTIFRKSELALKTGFYDFSSDHRKRYYKQAVSTNALVFQDPRDPEDHGEQRNMHYQEAGSLEDYLAHKKLPPFVETGNLVAVDDPAWATSTSKNFHFVSADVAPAWDSKKVKSYLRQVAFLDGKHLIVVDRATTAAPEIRARWLLHSIEKPEASGSAWLVRAPDSVLWVQPLLPAKAKVALIGGPGHECEVDGVNWTYLTTAKYKSKAAAGPDPALGLWRMEIEPAEPTAEPLFVTVLTAADPGQPAPEASARIDGGKLTVTVGKAGVTFNKLDN